MRYKDFLTEWMVPEKTADAIKTDCQPFLKAINSDISSYPIFRGLGRINDYVVYKKVRLANRKPVDSDSAIHDSLNRYFTKKFGTPYRNAMFTANDASISADYGELYLVFPDDNFTFLWSPIVNDLHVDLEDEFAEISSTYYTGDQTPEELDKIVHKVVSKLKYTDKNLKGAIASGNEIMIRTEGYYGIQMPSNTRERNSLIKKIERWIKK